jgi:WD40 repeat protein
MPNAGAGSPQFSRDGRLLGWTQAGSQVQLWEVGRGACRTVGPDAFDEAALSPDGRFLTCQCPGGVRLLDWESLQEVALVPAPQHQHPVFDPRDGSLLTCSPRGIHRWPIRREAAAGAEHLRVGPPSLVGEPVTAWRASLARHAPKLVVADRWHGQAVVLNLTGKPGKVVVGPAPAIDDVAISPDGRWVAGGNWWGWQVSAWVWNADTGMMAWQMPGDAGRGRTRLAFSPDGRWLVTAAPPSYRFWKVPSWEPGPVIALDHGYGALAFSGDGKLVAISPSPGIVRLLNAGNGQALATLAAPDPHVFTRLHVSDDGARLAAVGGSSIQLWDLRQVRRELVRLGLDWDGSP